MTYTEADARQHIEDMKRAIREAVAGDDNHGSFVSYMAERNFEQAYYAADGINRANFGELVGFRLLECPRRIAG